MERTNEEKDQAIDQIIKFSDKLNKTLFDNHDSDIMVKLVSNNSIVKYLKDDIDNDINQMNSIDDYYEKLYFIKSRLRIYVDVIRISKV